MKYHQVAPIPGQQRLLPYYYKQSVLSVRCGGIKKLICSIISAPSDIKVMKVVG